MSDSVVEVHLLALLQYAQLFARDHSHQLKRFYYTPDDFVQGFFEAVLSRKNSLSVNSTPKFVQNYARKVCQNLFIDLCRKQNAECRMYNGESVTYLTASQVDFQGELTDFVSESFTCPSTVSTDWRHVVCSFFEDCIPHGFAYTGDPLSLTWKEFLCDLGTFSQRQLSEQYNVPIRSVQYKKTVLYNMIQSRFN